MAVHQAKRSLGLLSLFYASAISTPTLAHPLMGNVKAVQSTPFGAAANPANYGFTPESQAQGAGALRYSSAKFRVPGLDTMSKQQTGISISDIPNSVIKLAPNFGLSLTPFYLPTSVSGKIDNIPILFLNQVNRFDVGFKITSVTFVNFGAGVKFGPAGVGAGVTYVRASGEVKVRGHEDPTDLAVVSFQNFSMVALKLGLRLDVIPKTLTVGVSTNALTQAKIGSIGISSPIVSALPKGPLEDEGATSDAGGFPSQNALTSPPPTSFDQFLFGWGLAVGPVIGFADFDYKRKPANTKILSLSKFKVAEADITDSVAFRGGGKLRLPRLIHNDLIDNLRLIGGIQYEPSDMGPGDSAANGKTGFNPFTLIPTNFGDGLLSMAGDASGVMPAGFGAKVPLKAISGGIEFESLRRSGRERHQNPYRATIALGGFYKIESIGVDATGDSPMAFEKQTFGGTAMFIIRF